MSEQPKSTEVFSFDEAINLFHTGAHSFVFRNSAGGKFTSQIDGDQRIFISSIPETDEVQEGDLK